MSDEQVTVCPFRRCVGTMLSRLFHGSFYSAFTEFLMQTANSSIHSAPGKFLHMNFIPVM